MFDEINNNSEQNSNLIKKVVNQVVEKQNLNSFAERSVANVFKLNF